MSVFPEIFFGSRVGICVFPKNVWLPHPQPLTLYRIRKKSIFRFCPIFPKFGFFPPLLNNRLKVFLPYQLQRFLLLILFLSSTIENFPYVGGPRDTSGDLHLTLDAMMLQFDFAPLANAEFPAIRETDGVGRIPRMPPPPALTLFLLTVPPC